MKANGYTKNASDLDVGRRPKHKSDELFGVTIRVNEIISLLCLKPPKQVIQISVIGNLTHVVYSIVPSVQRPKRTKGPRCAGLEY